MKITFNKIKTSLATLWIAIVSFFSKVFGQSSLIRNSFGREEDIVYQSAYWVSNPIYNPIYNPIDSIITTKKIVQLVLLGTAFIIWLINFIKIRKINDKVQRKKRIKRTIITLVILLVTIFLVQLVVRRIMAQRNNTY